MQTSYLKMPLIKTVILLNLHTSGVELFALRYEYEINWSFLSVSVCTRAFPTLHFQHNIYPCMTFDNISNRNYFRFLILAQVHQARESIHR